MIKSFRSKALKEFFETGTTAGISSKYQQRLRVRLDTIHSATTQKALDIPGWSFHLLRGDKAGRCAIAVSGPWRLTFEFKDGDAYRVDFEQYH